MWFRKSSPRRQAIREDVVEAENLVRTPRTALGAPLAVSLLFFLIATLIVYFPGETFPYRVGDRPLQALRARVPFALDDPAELETLRQAQRQQAPLVLQADEKVLSQIEVQLRNLEIEVTSLTGTPASIRAQLQERFPELDDAAVREIQRIHRTNEALYGKGIDALVALLRSQYPIVDGPTAERAEEKTKAGAEGVRLAFRREANIDELSPGIPRRDLLALPGEDKPIPAEFRTLVSKALPAGPLVTPIAGYLARLKQPVFVVDSALTQKLAESRARVIRPSSKEFKADEVIVAANKPISELQYRQLLEAQAAYERDLAKRSPWAYWLSHLGEALIVGVLTAAGTLYITRMNPQANTRGRGWAVCGLMLLTLFIAKNATALLPHTTFMLGVAPTLLASIILIIVFNQRFALAIASIHGLLVTLALGQSFEFFLTLMTGISVFTFGLREIRTRARLIEVGVFASAGLFASVWALGLARMTSSVWSPQWIAPTEMGTIARDSLWAAGAGVLVGFITLGILPFIERVFKITTAMTLLELCDANRPLLRRLAQEAPGTFNHSLTVGIMAEAAADAIGVNGLLCRAGAYYHDVGKLSKPQYFIENQAGGPNRHDKLSPAMSLLIIVGHVKDGVELAREYALPWVLHQFIAQHHGTTLVEYFFHAARKRQEETANIDDTEVREAEFRYPGPKPQSKETAILMICDGVESMVRSIPDKSPGKIESAVHNLTMKRLMDGQFSECDLTLKELSRIELALAKALAGIYHGRVQYPTPLAVAQTA